MSTSFRFDLGDLSCGELTMALMKAIKPLPPGSTAEVLARDSAAYIDIAAWCHVTGHELVSAPQGPDDFRYVIRTKGE
jgi:tRNA 2-thiouridine synthesizing protein A